MIFQFLTMEIREARAHAAAGGQALHMMTGTWARGWGGPPCFRKAKDFAHLFDQDHDRLVATARRLGVKRIVVSKPGTINQHVDLCGTPLERAKAIAVASWRLPVARATERSST